MDIEMNLHRDLPDKMPGNFFTREELSDLLANSRLNRGENKILVEALKESEHRFHQMVQHLPAALYTCDAKGIITFYNDAAVALWGKAPEIGKEQWCGSWRIYKTDGSPLPLEECPMAITLKQGRAESGHEIIIERPDGVRLNILPYPQPIFDAAGKVVGAVNMLMDITPHRRDEQALRESEERFRNIADTAPVLIWCSDADGIRTFFNKGWLEFTGRAMQEELENGWMKGMHPDDTAQYMQNINEATHSGREFKLEYRLKNNEGSYHWITDHGVPRFDSNHAFTGFIGSCFDNHEQKLVKENLEKHVHDRTQELKMANLDLARSNNELEQFAYVASHDLQEPLRKIQSFANRILEKEGSELSETTTGYFNRMNSAASRMQQLIQDLLSYSRITASSEKEFQSADINILLEEAKAVLKNLIDESNTVIEGADLDSAFVVPFQLQQVLQNLISNSIKYQRTGIAPYIKIASEKVSGKGLQNLYSDKDYLHLTVTDNGIGFEQQYADRIFDLFQRLHGKSEYPGIGMGLAICKKIIQNHNGLIKAVSEPGKGSAFHIYLPLEGGMENS
jgi:PAS domain S-box-containing protein